MDRNRFNRKNMYVKEKNIYWWKTYWITNLSREKNQWMNGLGYVFETEHISSVVLIITATAYPRLPASREKFRRQIPDINN